MKTQNFENHKQFYTPHHFVFYPVILVMMTAAFYYALKQEELRALWIFLGILTGVVGWLSFMVRQHYAMTVQDRVILMEMRYRYFSLTKERFEPLESRLSKGQLFALRFASDEELPGLVDRALNENLKGTEIKKAIVNWRADWMRV